VGSYQQVSMVEMGNAAARKSPPQDHGHEHSSKDSGHSHSHSHTETTPLLTPLLPNVGSKPASLKPAKVEPFAFTKVPKCTGHAHDSGSHRVMEETPEKPSATTSAKVDAAHSHDHSSHSHAAHDHADLESGRIKESHHGHDHDHGHGHEGNYGSPGGGHADSHDGHAHGSHGAHSSDVNLEAAYLHVLTDLIQSIGVAIAGAVLWYQPGWQIIDPICTVLFSIVALNSTLPLINRVGMILFEGTPANVSCELFLFHELPGLFSR
jgi:hypothetical protein